MKRAALRCDASPAIGAGHVMRCLTLADILARKGWRCDFFCAEEWIAATDHAVHQMGSIDDPREISQSNPQGWDLLVIDHYGLDQEFESACRVLAKKILVIDDLADRPHDCDVLLDQTPGRRAAAYEELVPAECLVLAGSEYALLGRQYHRNRSAAISRRRAAGSVERILVNFGATDPINATALILDLLSRKNIPAAIDVVIGKSSAHLDGLRTLVEKLPLEVTLHIDPGDMAAIMKSADLAIGAGGVGALERCCLGLPSLVLEIAENQTLMAANLDAAGAACNLGGIDRLAENSIVGDIAELLGNSARRADMARAAANICDGLGAERVAEAIDPLLAKDTRPIRLRPATLEDGKIMLDWQTHPATRRYSRNPLPPRPEEHQKWLNNKLAEPDCVFNLILHDEKPAGVVRLDPTPAKAGRDSFEISVLVDPRLHGMGIATAAIRLATEMIPGARLVAEVDPRNIASAALFEGAGFRRDDRCYVLDKLAAARAND